jgi:hypothetical protein
VALPQFDRRILAFVIAAGAGHDDVGVVVRAAVGLPHQMLAGRAGLLPAPVHVMVFAQAAVVHEVFVAEWGMFGSQASCSQ